MKKGPRGALSVVQAALPPAAHLTDVKRASGRSSERCIVRHAGLHRPGAHLVVQRDQQHLVARAHQRVADHRVALGDVGLGLHRVDQAVDLGVADAARS